MADIDELQIKIVSSSAEAVKSVDSLKKALKGLDSALKSTGKDNAVSRVDRIKTGLKRLTLLSLEYRTTVLRSLIPCLVQWQK